MKCPKEAWATFWGAYRVFKRMKRRDHQATRPYRCEACHQWHLTSSFKPSTDPNVKVVQENRRRRLSLKTGEAA